MAPALAAIQESTAPGAKSSGAPRNRAAVSPPASWTAPPGSDDQEPPRPAGQVEALFDDLNNTIVDGA